MQKIYDPKSGAVIIRHNASELKQREESKRLNRNEKLLKSLCKKLGVSEEELEKEFGEE